MCPHQEGWGVKGGDGDGIKDLRLFQGFKLLLSVTQDLLQEGFLPGIKLQDLYSIQDLVHQSDAAIHELHLDFLWTRQTPEFNCFFFYSLNTVKSELPVKGNTYICKH